MKLPYTKTGTKKSRRQIISFYGVNYSQNTKDGELLESYGLSSAGFPCLSQRDGRKTAGEYLNPSALYARGELCVIDGTDFIYGGQIVGRVKEGEKHIAAINTKIVIFPDKVFYDAATETFGSLEADCTVCSGDAVFTSNTISLPERSYILKEREEEEFLNALSPDMTVRTYEQAALDREGGGITLSGGTEKTVSDLQAGDLIQVGCDREKAYMKVQGLSQWEDGSLGVRYILCESVLWEYPLLEEVFQAGDAVELSGCVSFPENNGSHIIRSISGRTLTFDRDIFSLTGTESGEILIERKIPDFSCICECDNRIWGAEGTTIYASALGDPTNFYLYDGLSTDSYAAAVGTDGDFTGCVAYSSTVLFFKEDCVHKVLGSYPAQYEIYTYTIPGIQKGSEKSACIINETLFYKGRSGIYAYTGGTPELISECFGPRRFSNAVAGSDGIRYYISMEGEDQQWNLYVYDPPRGIWLREDDTHAADFVQLDGVLYYLDAGSKKVMMLGQDRSEEGDILWGATLCQMDEIYHGRKGYSRLYLRANLSGGAWLKVEISIDNGPFYQVFLTHNENARTFEIPILPTRCDNFCIRLSGKGQCLLKSLVREFSVGSERG